MHRLPSWLCSFPVFSACLITQHGKMEKVMHGGFCFVLDLVSLRTVTYLLLLILRTALEPLLMSVCTVPGRPFAMWPRVVCRRQRGSKAVSMWSRCYPCRKGNLTPSSSSYEQNSKDSGQFSNI